LGEGTQDTRRRVAIAELIPYPEEKTAVEGVLKTLVDARLITASRNAVEVAHEALIREWAQLQVWLEEDREFLFWQQRLRAGLHQWQTSAYDEGALLRGAPLAEAENWLNQRRIDLNEAEREFIQASLTLRERLAAEREAQQRRELEVARELAETEKRRAEEQAQAAAALRKRAMWVAGVGLVAVILAIVAGLFGLQSQQNAVQAVDAQRTAEARREAAQTAEAVAEAQRDQAQTNLSRQMSTLAMTQMDEQLDLALLLSVEAANTANTYEARSSLLTGLETSPHLFAFLYDHTDEVNSVAFSPAGQTLASASDDRTIILWDVAGRQALRPPLTGHLLFLRIRICPNSFASKIWSKSTVWERHRWPPCKGSI